MRLGIRSLAPTSGRRMSVIPKKPKTTQPMSFFSRGSPARTARYDTIAAMKSGFV